MTQDLPQAFFQSLDDIVNLEFKAKRPMLGGTRVRYDAARAAADGPLVHAAARLLAGLPPQGSVVVTTGAGNPVTLPEGETDGPSGAAFLAHMLWARGHRILVLSDAAFLPGIVAAFRATGLSIGEDGRGDRILVEAFPLGAQAGEEKTSALLAEHPGIIAGLFIEKPGPNVFGVFHTSAGKAKDPESVAHLHLLAEALTAAGSVTLGIGDGGNEIGFGRVGRALEAGLPAARDCGCGCGGGIANATMVDCLVSASTSNWGAYGVAVALGLVTGRFEGLPPIEAVSASVNASMKAGANDGYSGENVNSVDGTSIEASEAVYRLCLEVAAQGRNLQ
ncbi:glutamate cyclase domain-containing protein [Acuticoccus kandeliae]|uniref:glutamate cyclase domain-containing protein n=1 Tax=Acuticoccus kandeliae TaxID=2073160 RepID=UPI000D3E877A|nr:glutamate cyclase domain-containing protein [Acuticoccus kandeliae]